MCHYIKEVAAKCGFIEVKLNKIYILLFSVQECKSMHEIRLILTLQTLTHLKVRIIEAHTFIHRTPFKYSNKTHTTNKTL